MKTHISFEKLRNSYEEYWFYRKMKRNYLRQKELILEEINKREKIAYIIEDEKMSKNEYIKLDLAYEKLVNVNIKINIQNFQINYHMTDIIENSIVQY